MKLYTTREIINRLPGPDGKPLHARCAFPDQPGGTLVWTPVMQLQAVDARKGDILHAMAGCTLSTKKFFKRDAKGKPEKDAKGNPVYGSAMLRCELVLTAYQPARAPEIIDRPVGVMLGMGSGQNSTQRDNLTPYLQFFRSDAVELAWDAPWLTLWAAPASNDARAGDFIEAYATSQEYAFLTATLFPASS